MNSRPNNVHYSQDDKLECLFETKQNTVEDKTVKPDIKHENDDLE